MGNAESSAQRRTLVATIGRTRSGAPIVLPACTLWAGGWIRDLDGLVIPRRRQAVGREPVSAFPALPVQASSQRARPTDRGGRMSE